VCLSFVALDNKLAPQAYIARVITDLDREFKAGFAKTKTAVQLQQSVAADTEKARREALAMITQVEMERTIASIHDTFGGTAHIAWLAPRQSCGTTSSAVTARNLPALCCRAWQ
jgi:hypothetical protein